MGEYIYVECRSRLITVQHLLKDLCSIRLIVKAKFGRTSSDLHYLDLCSACIRSSHQTVGLKRNVRARRMFGQRSHLAQLDPQLARNAIVDLHKWQISC